jgi:hypothetical protein
MLITSCWFFYVQVKLSIKSLLHVEPSVLFYLVKPQIIEDLLSTRPQEVRFISIVVNLKHLFTVVVDIRYLSFCSHESSIAECLSTVNDHDLFLWVHRVAMCTLVLLADRVVIVAAFDWTF